MRLFRRKKPRVQLYEIVTDSCTESLGIRVNELLARGWKVQGGVSAQVTKTGGNQYDFKLITSYSQAVIK